MFKRTTVAGNDEVMMQFLSAIEQCLPFRALPLFPQFIFVVHEDIIDTCCITLDVSSLYTERVFRFAPTHAHTTQLLVKLVPGGGLKHARIKIRVRSFEFSIRIHFGGVYP